MKGTMKRIVSILLAVALVITSLQYTPKTVSAADYTQLEYADIANNANNEFAASLKGSQIAVFSGPATLNVKQYQNSGFSELYLACGGVAGGANFMATINGQTVQVEGTGIRMYNAADYLTYEYNVLEVYDNNGDSIVVIYCPANAGNGTYEITGEKPTEEETEFVEGMEILQDTAFDPNDSDAWVEKAGGTLNGNGSISISVPAKDGGDNWSTQLKQTQISLENGKWYVASVTITSDVARNFQLMIQSDGSYGGNWSVINSADNNGVFAVEAGVPYTYTVKFQASGVANKYLYGIMMGYVGAASAAANVTVSNTSLKVYSNEPTVETTTQEESSQEESSEVTGLAISGLEAPEDAYVYNFVEAGEGFMVGFDDPNEDAIDGISTDVTYTYGVKVNVNGQTVTASGSGKTVDLSGLGLTEGTEYTVTMNLVYEQDGKTITSPASAETKFTYKTTASSVTNNGIAQIFFTTSKNDIKGLDASDLYTGSATNKPKVPTAVVVKGADGSVEAFNFGTANVRGNSTANAAKKPYNFKFDGKENLFGMGKAKKWSLLANLFDKTLMRNQIAMDFQRVLEESQGVFADGVSKAFTSECQPVDLYIDGVYAGTYSLIESVEVGGTRVDIDIDGIDEDTNEIIDSTKAVEKTINGTTYTLYDVLLELGNDNRLDDEAYYFLTNTETFAINEPEKKNDNYDYAPGSANKPEFVNLTQAFVKDFETALAANNYEVFSQYIDMESFVDFYITAEYFMTKDIAFSSTRFYIRDGVMYAGPLWDLDLSSGNNGANPSAENFFAQGFNWFKYLMANDTFASMVKERYTELQPMIKNIYSTGGKVDQAYQTVKESADANYTEAYAKGANEGWGYTYVYGNNGYFDQAALNLTIDQAYQQYGVYGTVTVYDNYEDYITEYKQWLKDRNEWLIEQWNIVVEDGLTTTVDGDVIAEWTPVEGATGYAVTYTPSDIAVGNISSLGFIAAAMDETTVYINDGLAQSYNFTDNGINLADDTAVTVAYTTDANVDANASYTNIYADYANADIALLNRVTVDELNATIITNVTNNGTAIAENVVLSLKDAGGNEVATQTIAAVPAGATASVTWNRTETAGDCSYTITTGLLTSGVTYTCNTKEAAQYVEDANLSAKREGATYAKLGAIPDTAFAFNDTGYFIETGAADQAIYIRLNGETVAANETGNSAMNYTVAYSALEYNATNVIQIEYVDRATDMVTMTTRIETVYVKVGDKPAEIQPDLSTVIANTPDVSGDDGWIQPAIVNNGKHINAAGTYAYYIAESYYVGGANNNGFFNGNIYGYYDTGTSITYGGGENNTVTGEAFGIASELIRVGVESVWISDGTTTEKLENNTSDVYWNTVNTDVLTFTASKFTLDDGEDEKVYYVTVRTVEGVDYSWPIKVKSSTLVAPTAPAGLVSTYNSGANTLYVAFGVVANATSYNLYIDGELVGEVTNGANIDVSTLGIKGGTTYSVQVTAVNVAGESPLSGAVSVEIPSQTTDQPEIDVNAISDWVQLTGVSANGAKVYVSNAILSTFGNDGLRGFYDAGTSTNWNITDAFKLIDVFAFVTTGSNASGVIIDGIKYTSDDTNVHVGNDCVYINQKLLDVEAGQEKIYIVTAIGSSVGTEGTFALKVVGESVPDTSGVEVPGDDGWTQVTAGVGSSNGSTYFAPTTSSVISYDVRMLANTGADVTYGGGANNTLEVPVFGFSVSTGTPKSVWVDGKKLGEDEVFINTNVISIDQSLFNLTGDNEKIYYITLRNSDGTDNTFPLKVVGNGEEETTTSEVPDDAEWTLFPNSTEYYYYIPSSATGIFTVAGSTEQAEAIHMVYTKAMNSANVDGEGEYANDTAGVTVPKTAFPENGVVYSVNLTDVDGNEYTIYVKKMSASAYAAQGVAVSVDYDTTTANISWTATTAAITEGYTYTVTFNGAAATLDNSSNTATYDLSELAYGTYDVVVNTVDGAGNVVGTTTIQYKYRDPNSSESDLVSKFLWEAKRNVKLTWTPDSSATGYAVYADGVLFDVIELTEAQEDGNFIYYVPAYAFANGTNAQNQPTTVGDHKYTLIALYNNETAETAPAYADITSAQLIGEEEFELFVNYIYGNQTTIWNNTGVDNVWNFTVCESTEKGDILRGAQVVVDYRTDGSSNITLVDRGLHSTYGDETNTGDQAWTIKASIYDQPITEGSLLNLSFDITGPAFLVGQQIQIKCVPEECDENDIYYGVDAYGYEEKKYTFEPVYAADGETVESAVLHYTNSFTTTNDTYDLLFGLGLLSIPEGTDETEIDINLSDTTVKRVYGVTSVSATGIPNSELPVDATNNSAYISWTTDVPSSLSSEYTYDLVIKDSDGNIVSVKDENGNVLSTVDENGKVLVSVPNATNGTTYYGFAEDTYTVEVSSIYDNSVTATKDTTMVVEIPIVAKPDIIITDISIPEGDHKVGDIVQVSVTMTNIGNADATPAAGNLAVMLYEEEATANNLIGYYTLQEEDHTLAAGASITKTINYTITEDDLDGEFLYKLVAMADGDNTIAESDETNNIHSVVYKAIQEVTLTNDGTDIIATWPEATEGSTYVITYTVDGVEKNVEVDSNSYTFPAEDVMANGSEVKVSVLNSDGTTAAHAIGMARADIIVVDVAPEGGQLYVGQAGRLIATVKNIGTAKGDFEGDNTGFVVKDTAAATYEWCNTVLSPNDTVEQYFLTVTPADTANVTGTVLGDDGNRIVESNENNNTFDYTLTVAEPLKEGIVDLKNTDGTVSVTWEDINVTEGGKTAEKYIITYVVDGETKTAEVAGDVTEYVFEEVLDNNTEVTVTGKYTDSDETVRVGTDTALCDFVIESIVPANGLAYVGQANNLLVTVKNIGTAEATPTSGNAADQIVSATFTNAGVFTNYGTVNNVIISPGEDVVVTVGGYTPTVAGTTELTAITDDINRFTESDETNNSFTTDIIAVEEDAVKLSLVEPTEQGEEPKIKTSWELPEGLSDGIGVDSEYVIKYVVDGVEITETVQNTAENTVVYYDEETGRYYTYLENNLDRDTQVYVYVVDGENSVICGVDTAEVDLVITGVVIDSEATEADTAYLDEEFNIIVSVKNQGTAKVEESSPDVTIGYGQWIITQLTEQANITVANTGLVSSNAGLLAGATAEYTYENVIASATGTYTLNFKTDSPGFVDVEVNGFIKENNDEGTGETNNTYASTLNVVDPPFVQEKMDWTLFTSQQVLEDGTPYVVINNGSDQKPVEFKVLDTSITDLHYYDIYTKVDGYAGQYIAFGINGEGPMVKSDDTGVTTKLYFAQVSSHTTDIYDYETTDSTINYGEARMPGDGLLQTWDGNGYQLHTRSFAAGKYYIVKLVNDDGSYLVLGLRVPGDLGNWVLAKPSDDSDPFKVPVVYHDKNHTVNGAVYYDGSDLGLAGMSVYNGNHLALTTDGTMKLNSLNWKMTIEYAHYNDEGILVAGAPEDIIDHIGQTPELVTLNPTDEIFGEQGANTILIKMPELMWELPIHSPLGGEWDSEYYILKVYPDTVNRPDDFVYIPLNIRGEIPMIESVNGLTVAGRGDTLSVMWTNSIVQNMDGYVYDVYIDKNHDGDFEDADELVSTDVQAGSYNYTDGIDVANSSGYSVKVVAKWCEQTAPTVANYVVGGDQETETLPGEEETYPEDNNKHKWVLIDGDNTLPVKVGTGEGGTTNGQIWYYTDDDMYSVVGYNEYYISLNGNTTYFTGDDSMLFVQDGPTDPTFESKIIHDKFYDGQILINAANMFTTYEDTDGDGVLYYTVKVTGENGNTEKNFYFKVVLNPENENINATGEWRLISGQYVLPVLFEELELQGTIEYYDYPTLTNTYNMTGYNDYFISVFGANDNYSGKTTQLFISEPSETEILGTPGDSTTFTAVAGNQDYTEKEIYDKVYRGQIQMRSSTTFTVKWTTTYYILKITGTAVDGGAATTTYVPVRVTVDTGDVEVQGFQMNTDNSETGIARYNPSMRVVSKASNVMTIGNVLHRVADYGTIYALNENVNSDYEQMVLDLDDTNEYVHYFQATKDVGTLAWTSSNGDEKYNKYYALSFEFEYYSYTSLTTEFAFRAYAILDDGTVVYGNNIYATTMEQIAENLYTNQKVGTEAAHNYLYDNVLNILAIGRNRTNIAKALMAATDVTSSSSPNYALVNQTYKDLWDYIYCRNSYTYSGRTAFACSTPENEATLLGLLDTENKYDSVTEWIYDNVENGFYEKVDYSFDNSIDKEFDSE